MLYHHPGSHVQDWGISFNSEQLRTIKESVIGWDMNAYLPQETLEWCSSALNSLGFDPTIIDRTEPFLEIYCQLREKIQYHIQNQLTPTLSLLQPPIGARNWQVC
jgi:hypothetical protein